MSLETARKVLKAELEAIEGLLERLDAGFGGATLQGRQWLTRNLLGL